MSEQAERRKRALLFFDENCRNFSEGQPIKTTIDFMVEFAEAERDALQKRVQDSCERGLRELVKLNNYALQHRNGIDVSWVVKVIEEVRACFEAALKGEAK